MFNIIMEQILQSNPMIAVVGSAVGAVGTSLQAFFNKD
jgi:hypothetical protein